jgi:hypothetical protein
VLPIGDQIDQVVGVEGALAESVGGDLTVDDLGGDVGVVG